MKNYSTTQTSNITAIIGFIMLILKAFNIEIGQEEVSSVVNGVFLVGGTLLSIVGVIKNWINRYKKGDITLGGKYK